MCAADQDNPAGKPACLSLNTDAKGSDLATTSRRCIMYNNGGARDGAESSSAGGNYAHYAFFSSYE